MALNRGGGGGWGWGGMHVDGDETKHQLSLNLNFETTPIEQFSEHYILEVTVDEQLKWRTHNY